MKHAEASAATHAALIHEFCRLYSRMPLEKVTVKEISAAAGVSRVTFYNYFSDPYELLDELEDGFITQFIETAQKTMDRDFESEAFFQGFMRMLETNGDLARTLFLGSHSGAFTNKIKDAAIPVMDYFLSTDKADTKIEYALEYHVSGMVALLKRWLLLGGIDAEQMATYIRELLIGGVLTTINTLR